MVAAPEAVNVVPEPEADNVAFPPTVNAPPTCDVPDVTVSEPPVISSAALSTIFWIDEVPL